jgi:acyl dehydratase
MTEKVVMAEGKITDEALREWEDRIGLNLRISHVFNRTVSHEAIRNYVNGIGDNNPLYRDEEYAKQTTYGKLVAPPSWLYSVFPTWVLQGLRGIHSFHSGNDLVFYQPIMLGDTIKAECKFIGYDVKPSKFSKKTVFEYQRSDFYNQRNELVARTNVWVIRAERRTARKTGKYVSIKLPHPYTDEELERIDEEVLGEEIRGSTPRYWEDIRIDEELPAVVKGPLGLTDSIAYCVGASPVQLAAHASQLKLYRKHPAWAFRDPATKAWEPMHGVHYNKTAANAAGLPYPYDVGTQRQGWLISMLCNWMGDEGWLKTNYAEYRRFVYHSDVVWLHGKVIKKYIDGNGEHCVDVETRAVNQRGEDTMPGFSIVVLPSRDNGKWPLKKRVSGLKT